MSNTHYALLTSVCICCLLLFSPAKVWPETPDKTREPNWAGSFYPADTEALTATLDNMTDRVQKPARPLPDNRNLRALIMPHAGYIYSGPTAAHASLVLSPGAYKKIILIGPDHHLGVIYGAVSQYNEYLTPLGSVPVHRDAYRLVTRSTLFRRASPALDQREHSLEVLVPFLQHYLGSFELVPIILGAGDVAELSRTLSDFIDDNTLIVVSSDLSHYLQYESAVKKDRDTMDLILKLDGSRLEPGLNQACGLYPLKLLLRIARDQRWQPRHIHYANSGDTAGTRDRVVGYATIAFYASADDEQGGTIMEHTAKTEELTENQGEVLLTLARQTIADETGHDVPPEDRKMVEKGLKDPAFQEKRGTFVTLTKQGDLRGCIGNITPVYSIADGVRQNAIQAAFNDPRFTPLKPEEFDDLEIEVSILTAPQPLQYKNGSDLLKKLRPEVDGVILRSGMNSSTFLPQVWEKLPDPEDFLNNLCLKAGLPSDYWRTGQLEVQTYQVQYFSE